jgi:16S rRNA A1518/A1519 N6-dimethyltransferase RsmA/KsgA/DIM1 with predicted DNA glycosylase/AP lyase activity
VDSAVVRLTPRIPPVEDLSGFLRFASAGFRQKRKNLRNNLGALFDKSSIETQPESTLRAEQLSIPQLIDLYSRLRGR